MRGPRRHLGSRRRALRYRYCGHSDVEIETAIVALGHDPGGGLVVMTDSSMVVHRSSIISAAARNRIPAVYFQSGFVRDGGLLSYGVDQVDNCRRAASHVDSILRGAKPGDLPVQFPVKYELVLNLQDRRGARPPCAAIDPAPRRRGDRMSLSQYVSCRGQADALGQSVRDIIPLPR